MDVNEDSRTTTVNKQNKNSNIIFSRNNGVIISSNPNMNSINAINISNNTGILEKNRNSNSNINNKNKNKNKNKDSSSTSYEDKSIIIKNKRLKKEANLNISGENSINKSKRINNSELINNYLNCEYNETIETLNHQLLEEKSKNQRLLEENTTNNKNIILLKEEICHNNEKINEQTIQIDAINLENQDIRENNKLINYQNKNLLDQIEFLSKELKNKEIETKELHCKFSNYSKNNSYFENNTTDKEKIDKIVLEIKREYNNELILCKKNYEEINTKLKNHFKVERDELNSKIKDLEESLESSKRNFETAKNELYNQIITNENEITYQKNIVKEYSQLNEKYLISIQGLEDKIKEYIIDIADKDRKLYEINEKLLSSNKENKENNEILNKTVIDLKLKIKEYETNESNFFKCVKDISDKVNFDVQILSDSNKKLNIFSQITQQMKMSYIYIEKLKIEIQQNQEVIKNLEINNKKEKRIEEIMHLKENELVSKYQQLNETLDSFEKENSQIKGLNNYLTKENISLKEQIKELLNDIYRIMHQKDSLTNIKNKILDSTGKDKIDNNSQYITNNDRIYPNNTNSTLKSENNIRLNTFDGNSNKELSENFNDKNDINKSIPLWYIKIKNKLKK